MSSSRDDRYYPSVGKSRRSSPGDAQSGVYFQTGHSSFQTGQGGRTVLPPLSSAFPTSRFPDPYSIPYSQPRSSPGRNDYNVSSLYAPWPNNPIQPPVNSFPFYESHDARYPPQTTYTSYSTRSTTPTIPSDSHGSRTRLPPLNVLTSTEREERWQPSSYPPAATHVPVMSNIRSPTASYPPTFFTYSQHQSDSYSYPAVPDLRESQHTVATLSHQPQVMQMAPPSSERVTSSRTEGRAASPYSRNQSNVTPPTYNPPPPQMLTTTTDEPVIKKKRKRADANQLKVLNETYNRTAFPSTEERADLAKKLDMSARSVQIWFQNKRQSMRQTSRQSSSSVTSSSHQPFSMTPQSDAMLEEITHVSVGGYASSSTMAMSSMHDAAYMSRSGHGGSRPAIGHTSQTPPPPRRHRIHEESVDPRKWPSRGY